MPHNFEPFEELPFLRGRVRRLEAEIRTERERAEAERRRADAAVESSARAWRLQSWPVKKGREE